MSDSVEPQRFSKSGSIEALSLSKDERGLLLYFESVSVDNYGLVNMRKMNNDDMAIARRWDDEKFVKFGRVPWDLIQSKPEVYRDQSSFVVLSDKAWEIAHALRKHRSMDMGLPESLTDALLARGFE